MTIVEFTQPGLQTREQKVGNRTVPGRTVPPAKFSVRADLIVAIEAPAEADDLAEVRTTAARWEITETYEEAVARWKAAI